MAKTPIIIALVLILIIAGAASYVYMNSAEVAEKKEPPSIKDLAGCKALGNSSESDGCYLNFAVEEKNTTICKNINDTWARGDCYLLASQK
jgi:uncharacterized protein YpmB